MPNSDLKEPSKSKSSLEGRDKKFQDATAETEKRSIAHSKADPVERALATHGNTFDKGVIVEAHETDSYVRDGNVVYPAPEPRPVGVSPKQVDDAIRYFGDVAEQGRTVSK